MTGVRGVMRREPDARVQQQMLGLDNLYNDRTVRSATWRYTSAQPAATVVQSGSTAGATRTGERSDVNDHK
jgi:hypothetical protein